MIKTQPISLLKLFLLYVSRTYLVAKGRDCGDGAISFMHQFHMPDARLPVECPGLPEPGGQGSHCLQILADQLTLFQTVGSYMTSRLCRPYNYSPLGFLLLPTALLDVLLLPLHN